MVFSDFSILMATIWCSIFMVLLFCFRSGKYILELSGVAPLLIIIIGAVLRCFVPIDIPVFTRVIQHEGWLAKLDAGLRTPIIYGHITPLAIILGVWIIGTLIASFTTIWSYRTHMDKVRAYLPSENPAILSAAEAAARKLQLPVPTVCPISKGKSPSIQGLRHPVILIPENVYSEEDYRYVFYHELMHWKEHDMWIKLLVCALNCIFWWNPCSYLLRINLNRTLELRCDQSVSRLLQSPEKLEYIEVLKKTFNSLPTKRKRFRLGSFTISEFAASPKKFCRNPKKHITVKRADLIMNTSYQKKYNRVIPVVTLIIMTIVFVFSYSFIIQPHYDVPKDEIVTDKVTEEVSAENSYLVKNPDGTYTLYVDNIAVANVDKKYVDMMKKDGFTIID
ncbi:MAG: M56 family metallopeptidase [Acutalibacteraceae bacterium]